MAKGVLREVTKEEEGFIKDNFRYDPETGYLWWTKQNGGGRSLGRPAGSLHCTGYIVIGRKVDGVVKNYLAHRLAWFIYHGMWPKDQIDHINNIRSDNRIVNLREATNSENQANRKIREGGASKYKGVSWHKGAKKWQALIEVNRKQTYLGQYDLEEEAALAYNKAALEYFGEFAKINIIEPLDTGVTNTYISSSSGELTY